MSVFDAEFAAKCKVAILARFAQAITYHPIDGADISTDAAFTEETTLELDTTGGRSADRRATLQVDTDDVATRSTRDSVTITATGEIWEVESLGPIQGEIALLNLIRGGRLEVSQRGYRSR